MAKRRAGRNSTDVDRDNYCYADFHYAARLYESSLSAYTVAVDTVVASPFIVFHHALCGFVMRVWVRFHVSASTPILWSLDHHQYRDFLSLRKSPHRFVLFSSLRNPRVEKPKSYYAVIVFDTDQEPLRIAEKAVDRDTEFLPFLNLLIDRLEQKRWASTDLTRLLPI